MIPRYRAMSAFEQADMQEHIARLEAQLGDLPEAQSVLLSTIKTLKAEIVQLRKDLNEQAAINETLKKASKLTEQWAKAEIDKYKNRIRRALDAE